MTTEQDTIMHATAQAAVGAARVVIQATTAVRTDNNERMLDAVPKIGRSIMHQHMCNWETEDKYSKLKNFI